MGRDCFSCPFVSRLLSERTTEMKPDKMLIPDARCNGHGGRGGRGLSAELPGARANLVSVIQCPEGKSQPGRPQASFVFVFILCCTLKYLGLYVAFLNKSLLWNKKAAINVDNMERDNWGKSKFQKTHMGCVWTQTSKTEG